MGFNLVYELYVLYQFCEKSNLGFVGCVLLHFFSDFYVLIACIDVMNKLYSSTALI